MHSLRLQLFGYFRLAAADDREIPIASKKGQALLAYLALDPDGRESRQRLATLLWGDRFDDQARASLRQCLFELRKALSDDHPDLLATDGEAVSLDRAAVWVDVREFERLAADRQVEPLRQAEALYRGDLLEDFDLSEEGFADWLRDERTRLRTAAYDVLEGLADRLTDQGLRDAALTVAQRLVALDGIREDGHRLLMRLYIEAGRRNDALRQYQLCSATVRAELGVEPEAETTTLFQSIRDGAPPDQSEDDVLPRPAAAEGAPEGVGGPAEPARKARPGWRWALIGGVVLAILSGFGLWFWLPKELIGVPTLAERPVLPVEGKTLAPITGKPSIAVLPFINLSTDPEQEYFADGLAEDIITDLTKISGLFVTARNSSFAYKGKRTDLRTVARELGVRYVLEGSVRRNGDQIRVNAQLIDGTTGGHLWAERYDGTLAGVFALQDRLTDRITKALQVVLTPDEAKQLQIAETASVEAYDAFLKGWEHYLRTSPEDFAVAVKYFSQAIEIDPDYARARAALGLTYWQASERLWEGVLPYPGQEGQVADLSWRHARVLSMENLELALQQPTAVAHRFASAIYLVQRRFGEAIAAAEQAVASDPNDAESLRALAYAEIMAGRPEGALRHIANARRLDPLSPEADLFNLGLAQFALGRVEDAAGSLERARAHNPNDLRIDPALAAAYGLLGRQAEGKAILESNLDRRNSMASLTFAGNIGPGPYRLIGRMFYWPFQDRVVADLFARGLLEVGQVGSPGGYHHLAAANRLTGAEIRALLFGRNYRVRLMSYGVVSHFTIATDGQASRTRPNRQAMDSGKAWIEGDLLCERYNSAEFFGAKQCHTVFRNSRTADSERYSHVFASVTGINRVAVVE